MRIGTLLVLAEASYTVFALSDLYASPGVVTADELSSKPSSLFGNAYTMLPVKRAFDTACLSGSGALRPTTAPALVPNLRLAEDVELETSENYLLTRSTSLLREICLSRVLPVMILLGTYRDSDRIALAHPLEFDGSIPLANSDCLIDRKEYGSLMQEAGAFYREVASALWQKYWAASKKLTANEVIVWLGSMFFWAKGI